MQILRPHLGPPESGTQGWDAASCTLTGPACDPALVLNPDSAFIVTFFAFILIFKENIEVLFVLTTEFLCLRECLI